MLEKLKICIYIYPKDIVDLETYNLEAYGIKINIYLDAFLSNPEELIKDRLIAQVAKYYSSDKFSDNIVSYSWPKGSRFDISFDIRLVEHQLLEEYRTLYRINKKTVCDYFIDSIKELDKCTL
ncbi:MAG: hypothetical protein ACI4V7_06445 [Succinivibrionaceae bacterium]